MSDEFRGVSLAETKQYRFTTLFQAHRFKERCERSPIELIEKEQIRAKDSEENG